MNGRPLTIFKRESFDSYDAYCNRKDVLKVATGVTNIRHEKTGTNGDYRWHILWDQRVERPTVRFEERLQTHCRKLVMDAIEFGKLKLNAKGKPVLELWQSAYEQTLMAYEFPSVSEEFKSWLKTKPGLFAFAYQDAVKLLVEDVEEQKRAVREAGL